MRHLVYGVLDTSKELPSPRRPHKGGKIHRFEPTNLKELLASPMIVTSFKWLGCFEFCE